MHRPGPSRSSAVRSGLATLGLALALLVGAAPVHALETPIVGGFSAQPVDAQGRTLDETYFTMKLPPGGSATGAIQLGNENGGDLKVRVDPVDGLTGVTSGAVYANRDDPRKETGRWLTPEASAVTVGPGSKRAVRFTVTVPADAKPGDHVGAIAFQTPAKPSSDGNFSVKQIVRVAVAVQIRVEGPARRAAELGGLAIEPIGGTQVPSVVVDTANTGGLLCRPELTVALSRDGQRVGSTSRELDTILPGDTIPYPLQWPDPLQAGTYQTDARLTGCGKPVEVSADVVLKQDLRGTAAAPGPASLPDDGAGGIPLWAVGLIAGVALFGGFLLARRKPRDRERAAVPH